jgi:hypothetical protein
VVRCRTVLVEIKEEAIPALTVLTCRFERPPITEPKVWWHKMAVKRKDVYRRLALEHVGAESIISEHTIVRAHDRSYPLLIKMFFSNNYGARSFAATDTKVTVVLATQEPRT